MLAEKSQRKKAIDWIRMSMKNIWKILRNIKVRYKMRMIKRRVMSSLSNWNWIKVKLHALYLIISRNKATKKLRTLLL